MNRIFGAAATQLWQSHQQELARESGKTPLAIVGPDAVRDFVEQHHAVVRDFHVGRRVSAAHVGGRAAAAGGGAGSCSAARRRPRGSRHAGVLAELDRLQNKRRSWASALPLLVVSLALFVGAGGSAWSWEFVLLAVPVLLFHELGHYVAMRVFGYRNLRMFFIPMFGAAVSGRNYNAPGCEEGDRRG